MYLHETSRTVGIFHLPALVFEIWAFTFAKMEVGHPVVIFDNLPRTEILWHQIFWMIEVKISKFGTEIDQKGLLRTFTKS